jgi:hypothetical protein
VSVPRRSPGRRAARRAAPLTGTPAAKTPPNQTRLGSRPLVAGAAPPTNAPAAPAPAGGSPNDAVLPPAPSAGPNESAAAAAAPSPFASVESAAIPFAGAVSVPHPLELAGLLHELSAQLLGASSVAEALDRLVRFATGAIPGVARCSVTLITDGEPLTRAVSGTAGQGLDDRQYAVGQGPGLDAARTRALVTAQDLAADARWPELADCARAEGVQSVAAIPLDAQRSSVGSLSLFVARPNGIEPELLLTAMALVSQAEVLLAELCRREALSDGATVDRAVGVIIAQRGCGVREAYDVLHETALHLGMDRRSVAERLLSAAAARNATPPRNPTRP